MRRGRSSGSSRAGRRLDLRRLQRSQQGARIVRLAAADRQSALHSQLTSPVEREADGEHERFPDTLALGRHRFDEGEPVEAEPIAQRRERQRAGPVPMIGLHHDTRPGHRLQSQKRAQTAQIFRRLGQALGRAVGHEDEGIRFRQKGSAPRRELFLAGDAEDLAADGNAVEAAADILQPIEYWGTPAGFLG